MAKSSPVATVARNVKVWRFEFACSRGCDLVGRQRASARKFDVRVWFHRFTVGAQFWHPKNVLFLEKVASKIVVRLACGIACAVARSVECVCVCVCVCASGRVGARARSRAPDP